MLLQKYGTFQKSPERSNNMERTKTKKSVPVIEHYLTVDVLASMEEEYILLLQDQLIPNGSVLNRHLSSKSHKISVPPLIGPFDIG
ncbi:hypothetical protein ACN92M_25835 (plasmid) [Paenibacillus polymyxa]|uniref:hypothetical protein n=1 Tax=Paenibacillus polymyxa TaxID=1406 RepID=UPI003B5A44E0